MWLRLHVRAKETTEAIGNTAPNLPPPPKKKGSWFKRLITIVIAVIVAFFTQQWYLVNVANTTAAAATAAQTFAAYAVGGAAGSVASQVAGNALGIQNGFSFKAVAAAALSAGFGEMAGAALPNLGSQAAQLAARAAIRTAFSQGVNVAMGLQNSFSWKAVALSAVAAPLADKAGEFAGKLFENAGEAASNIAAGVAYGVTSQAVTKAFTGGKFSVEGALSDGFGYALGRWHVQQAQKASEGQQGASLGNAIGSSLAEAMGPQNSAQENFRLSEIRDQNAQASRDAAYGFDTSYSGMGLRAGAGNGVGLSYAGMRAAGLPDEGQYARTTTPDLDTSAVAALRENLGLPEAAPDMGVSDRRNQATSESAYSGHPGAAAGAAESAYTGHAVIGIYRPVQSRHKPATA